MESSSSNNIFLELKMCCLQVLELVQNPNHKHSPALSNLLLLLRSSPPSSLHPLFDYTLFPLLLLLDAAVNCRSSKKLNTEENGALPVNTRTLNKVSDTVAEGVLQCLEVLLSKCHLSSMNQMIVLLKKLTYGAMLSPSEASEEFRGGIVKCFRALLLNLTTCSVTSCSCRHSSVRPLLMDVREYKGITTNLERHSQPTECLIAFLQSEGASAAVGHWLSLILNIADAEGARGLKGSAKLRTEALLTLRVLVAKVGSPDALAFFLPGVVSQLAKVLHVSKSMISGAAGSAEATEHAVRGLAEFLIVVLQDDANTCDPHVPISRLSGLNPQDAESPQSFLEELRHLPVKAHSTCHDPASDLCGKEAPKRDLREKQRLDVGVGVGPLHVKRTPDWVDKASANVNKFLEKTFPHICLHPSKRVRRGLLSAIQGLLLKCSHILKGSRLMLLECLCILVCDDSEEVSAAAQDFLGVLFTSHGKHVEDDVAELFNRLLEKLPKVVLGSEESMALASAQQMLAVIYYSGPEVVVDHLLRSPIQASKFFDVLSLCLSQQSVFAGSLGKLVLSKPSPVGYLHSLAELRVGSKNFVCENAAVRDSTNGVSNMAALVNDMPYPTGDTYKDYEIPHMPPWFVQVCSHKLYQALAGVLRLVGRSLIADCRSEVILTQVLDIPLGHLRKLISDIRMKEYNNESWESWCMRAYSGQLLRQAGSAACILNEMLYGLSDQSINSLRELFHECEAKVEEKQESDASALNLPCNVYKESHWKVAQTECQRQHIVDCVGVILHEYITPEVWDVPIEPQILRQSDWKADNTILHICKDAAMLQQVLIDGIGIFNLCLGKSFASSGYLCSSLYLLLENLIYSNSQVSHAADAVLRLMSAISGYASVGHLVVANSDYVIDSLCQQLRHLDLNPHVPNVLAAMLSYVGVAHKILPLLEEPMRCVSMELEILGRRQHPELTVPFLKALAAIAKAAKVEANGLPAIAESFMVDVLAKVSDVKRKFESNSVFAPDDEAVCGSEIDMGDWESILFQLNDNKRCRRMVASIASSCLTAVTPLLASDKESICLTALNIIEDGMTTLAKVEEAFRHENKTKEAIDDVASLCSLYPLKDILDAAEDGPDENRLLPAMNKIWPYLVACFRNRIPVPVRRCAEVVSNLVKLCGGNFFTRRFHTDGSNFWKLLITSPFKRKSIRDEEKATLLLPYRNTSRTLEDPVSESSSLKVQAAVLRMIADLALDRRSSSALEVVLKKVSGLVVGIACSGVVGLRDASIDALSALASIDPDLIWLLLADIYYSMNGENVEQPSGFPEVVRILPPPKSSKDYLYVQYGGQTYGFDIDFSSVDFVFRRLFC